MARNIDWNPSTQRVLEQSSDGPALGFACWLFGIAPDRLPSLVGALRVDVRVVLVIVAALVWAVGIPLQVAVALS